MTYSLQNIALPEEEAKHLPTHVKMCTIRHAQTIDEIRKTAQDLKEILSKHHESTKEEIEDFKKSSNDRQTRNEKVFVVAFFVIAASLWPQLVSVLAPIVSAFTGFAIPVARAITGL